MIKYVLDHTMKTNKVSYVKRKQVRNMSFWTQTCLQMENFLISLSNVDIVSPNLTHFHSTIGTASEIKIVTNNHEQ